jgi:adenosylcobinamide-GDP ribazoletransferase
MILRDLVCDLLACLRFYSRLPLPVLGFEPKPHAMLDFARAIRMLPLAGALIAAPSALILVLAAKLGLAPGLVAGFTLAASVLTTGVFHEDGLADTADGFGGGATIERKLEIMRDSRIGSYGGMALALALLLRWSALGVLIAQDVAMAALAWVALAGLTRTVALLPLVLLLPARRDGAAYAAARPQPGAFAFALVCALLLAALPCVVGVSPLSMALAVLAALTGSAAVTLLSWRQIRGQTGDVAGAAQQVAEILALTGVGLRL